MEKLFLFSKIIFLSLAIALVTGCKKDKDEDEQTPEIKTVTFESDDLLDEIPVGIIESDDLYANTLYTYIQSAVNMSSFIEFMTPPDNAQKINLKTGDTYKWSFTKEGTTYTFYWTFSEDATKYYWTLQRQIDDGVKCKFVEAWQTKDGKKGEILYNINYWNVTSDPLYSKYTWELTSLGIYYFNNYIESSNELYTYNFGYELMLNPDGSGTLDYYYNDVLSYKYSWDSMGNGTWTWYLNGEIYDSGSWTVTK